MQQSGIVTRFVDVKLDEHEIFEFGKEQSKLLGEIKEFEQQRKEVNDQIKPRKKRIDVIAVVINSGMENRAVDCYWDYDWDNGIKNVRRCDTDVIVGTTEKIGVDEQRDLPLESHQDSA